jgi:hypothetical protein
MLAPNASFSGEKLLSTAIVATPGGHPDQFVVKIACTCTKVQ